MLPNNHKFCIKIIFFIVWLAIGVVKSQPNSNIQSFTQSEPQTLLKFKQSLNNTHALNNWVPTIPHCVGYNRIWVGLLCFNGTVWGLKLENMSLSGSIDINILTKLPNLRTISFKNNSFNGPLPQISKLNKLRSVFLSYNNFSGEIDEFAFMGMSSLMKVYLDHNDFSGKLPKSLVELPKLIEFSIQDNHFDGNLVDFVSNEFRVFNLSYNDFDGQIPSSLSHLNSSSFLGNQGLCGEPLAPCQVPTPTSSNPHQSSWNDNKSLNLMLIIVITIGVLLIMTGFFLLLVRHQNKKLIYQQHPPPLGDNIEALSNEKARKVIIQTNDYDLYPSHQPRAALDRPTSYRKSDNGKLCFLRNDRQKFEMQDLLKASAEVLGSGSFGSSYKASVSMNGPTFVVKRFRQMNNVGKEDFQEHMKLLGRLRHPNILPLVAFFHKRDEKLIISDFVENGSLASHLHGRRSPDQAGLEWPIRLKIIKGVARGLAYLYREFPQLSLPHGNLKSSNVLLNDNFDPLLSDYALSPLVNRHHAEQVLVAYKSPEFIQDNMKITSKKTDVWCLGILILEIMTGQFPANYLKHGRGGNQELATWVESVVKEEWSPDIFDVDMRVSRKCKGEMLKLLKIGMMCCEWNVDKRWNLRETVQKIEELKEQDRDEEDPHVMGLLHDGSDHRELVTTISSISHSSLSFRE